jgi:hypothetical protein
MELPLSVPEEEEGQEEEDLFDGTVTSPVAFRLSMRMSQPAKSPEDMMAEITDLKRLLYSATTEERRAAIRTSIDALERALDPVGRMDDEVGGSKGSQTTSHSTDNHFWTSMYIKSDHAVIAARGTLSLTLRV